MRENRLRTLWGEGKAALGGWLALPDPFAAEVMAHAGFDWLCVDTQHGLIDYSTAVAMLQAISTTNTVPLVRVPSNEPGIIGKHLDAGAAGIIVPMVNTPDEARAAVAACRYPPEGARSYGPLRASFYAGFDYYEHANGYVCCIVMIETREALGNVDAILDVAGIDAVYVGPADLSVSLGLRPAADQDDETFTAALDTIVTACRRRGIVPGIAGNDSTAPKRLGQGFRLVEVGADAALLARGASRALASVRDAEGAVERTAYL